MHKDRQRENYLVYATDLKVRAVLGDRLVLPELAGRASWTEDRVARPAKAGLDALLARYGLETLLTGLGTRSTRGRIAAITVRHHAGEDVTDHLADPDREVAYATACMCRRDEDRLLAYLDRAPTVEAKLWTAYALYWNPYGEQDAEELFDSLGRVEIAGLDEEVRWAVLHEHMPDMTGPQTDPRWRLELLLSEPLPPSTRTSSYTGPCRR